MIRDKDFIKPIKKNDKINSKFITLDLECHGITDSNNETNLVPFLVGLYNPNLKLAKTLDLTLNYQLHDAIRDHLLTYKYSGYIIYAHNLSTFDGIFILNQLVKLSDLMVINLEPLFRDSKLIEIKVSYGYNNKNKSFRYSIIFRDSMLMFLISLDKLSKTFLSDKPELQKDTNKGKTLLNTILYKSELEINNILKNDNFIYEIKNYCMLDCISLWHVIDKFNFLIFERYQLNIHNYPTLPSLAFAIFRGHFLIKNQINKINEDLDKELRKSYTGGHVDLYHLYSNKESRLYDFTSLYPTAMTNNIFPTKLIDKFRGDPFKSGFSLDYLHNDNIRSFINCDIFVDRSINRPVYQTHMLINNQLRTVCGTGIFKNQLIFLPELLKYQELSDNKIRIIDGSITSGLRFKCEPIFNDFIYPLFKLKNSVPKSHPLYLISKLIMNSLYGRFGLRPELHEFRILDNLLIDTIHLENNLDDIIEFPDTNKSMLVINKNMDNLNISVAIASAITAYARMIVAPILLDESIKVLYTDTDSYVIEGDLSTLLNGKYAHMLHNELGGLKLEAIFSEFVSLAPKVYMTNIILKCL